MKIEKSTIRYPGIFAVASFAVIASGFAEVFCPKYVTIEEGDTAMVSCNITAREIVFVYWYKGDTAITSPILRLEKGKPGGTEYGRGHYNITSNGAMIITDAKVVHEALYTTLMHFQDGTGESKHINVNITFTPWPSCPIIDGCLPCEKCSLAVNESGKLVCHINGARPIIPLKWIIKNQHGVSILKEPAIFTKDIGFDTWNSSVELSFGVSSCNQQAIILCVAEDHLSILDQFDSVIRIFTEDCSYTSPVAPSVDTINIFIIASVLVAGISAVIVVTFIYVIWRKKKMMHHEGFSSVPSDEVPLDMQEITPETVQKLILDLKTKYKVNCLIEPLPWRRPIDVFDRYVGYDCEVTDKNGGTSNTSTDGLLSSNGIISEQRVLITSSSGYGKTLFTKQFVQQWIQNIKSDLILLFISKREAKANMKLIDFFEKETSLAHDVIAQIIQNRRCLLFLDGLFNILFHEDGNEKVGEDMRRQSHSENTNNNNELLVDLTLPALFKRLEKSKNTKFQLWMTADDKENIAVKFSLPYVKVTINQVRDKQFDEFITKACMQCSNLLNQNVTEQDSGTIPVHTFENEFQANDVNNKDGNRSTEKVNQRSQRPYYKLNNKQPEERSEKVRTNVKEFLKRHQIYQELKENPILLSLIVYTVVRKCLSLYDGLHDFKAPGLEEVISTVINSLQEAYCKKHENTPIFEESLGKIALGLITEQGSVKEKHSHNLSEYKDVLNLALEMGIVQTSYKTSDVQLEDQNTDSSWSNHLQFCSKYFKYYYAAKYLVQSKIYYNEELAKYETPENFPVFKFIFHLEKWPGNKVLESFRNFKTDDEIIDFLLKWDDQEGLRKVISELDGAEISINNLTNLEHRLAFKSFCEKCCIMKIKLKSIHIVGSVPSLFITSLGLPVLDELIFSDLKVKKEAFLKILKYLSTKDITLRFFECKMAKDLDRELKQKPEIIDGIRVQISHDDDDILIKLQNCFKDDATEGDNR